MLNMLEVCKLSSVTCHKRKALNGNTIYQKESEDIVEEKISVSTSQLSLRREEVHSLSSKSGSMIVTKNLNHPPLMCDGIPTH